MRNRKRWGWLLAALALLLAAGGLFWYVSLPVPSGPALGTELSQWSGSPPATAGATGRFRIGTFNIHGGTGTDGRRDLTRVAAAVAACRLDFVALEEVHGRQPWQQQDQASELGKRLKLAWLFAPAERNRLSYGQFGNGLLSLMEATRWKRIPLPQQRARGYRNAVLVLLNHGPCGVQVLLTHITRNNEADRQEQLRTVLDMFLRLQKPAVLLGDLNTTGDDPQLRRVLALPGVGDPLGQILGPKAPPRIDWIITRGLRCRDAGVYDNGASDHPLVWAELETSPRADQYSRVCGTGILPVREKHGQDARATTNGVAQIKKLIGPETSPAPLPGVVGHRVQ